jgi:hypothetical protein
VSSSLFEFADQNEIFVEYKNIPANKSLSTEVFEKGFVALDYSLLFNHAEENTHLAHELGHCATGSFYKPYSKLDIRGRHEYRANKWAVHKLIPFAELQRAFSEGVVERWELAERFAVTEDFIETAVQIYQNEGALKV